MRIILFEAHKYEKEIFESMNVAFGHEITFVDTKLNERTVELARGFEAVCSFVNDKLDRNTLLKLKELGIKVIALRSAGFNHVDVEAANKIGIPIIRVPAYSPYAVAEHAVGLMLTLNRKIHRAYSRVRELNFSLDGLVGFDLHGKTVGVVGTGNIGSVFAKIMKGFGCRVLAFDIKPNPELLNLVEYVDLPALCTQSDIISLHVPLNAQTKHLISSQVFEQMKKTVMLVNTGRGALIDTKALIQALKQHRIGGACLDVYEEEEGIFFQDMSTEGINDDLLARLLTFPNVIVTSHQAFLTREALSEIARTTLSNLDNFQRGTVAKNFFVTT